jgi:hypothetical protein
VRKAGLLIVCGYLLSTSATLFGASSPTTTTGSTGTNATTLLTRQPGDRQDVPQTARPLSGDEVTPSDQRVRAQDAPCRLRSVLSTLSGWNSASLRI